jgi:hypothetical protein
VMADKRWLSRLRKTRGESGSRLEGMARMGAAGNRRIQL